MSKYQVVIEKRKDVNIMVLKSNNCKNCPEFNKSCHGEPENCMCKGCPRNLGKCIITKYCTETESILQ